MEQYHRLVIELYKDALMGELKRESRIPQGCTD